MPSGIPKTLDEKVEADTQKLISRLKSCDIRTLILEMGNRKPISENIVERQKRDRTYGSQDSPSWFAFRVSDELNDSAIKPELTSLLNEQKFQQYRQYILRCLSSLCVNTQDYELFDFLMSELQKDDDEKLITTVLSRLGELKKPATLNIDFLKHLFLQGTYQNSMDALTALSHCEHSGLEEILLQEFKTSDTHTRCMICDTLSSTGTIKSIKFLESEYKRSRNMGLKYFMETALENIRKRENGVG